MADFTNPPLNIPVIGQTIPRNNRDVGALITLTNQGAGTLTSPDQGNPSARGVRVTVDISAKTGTIDVTVKIQSKDIASGKYVDRLASVSLTAVGTTEYTVHPDLTAAANLIAKDFIGEVWRVQVINGVGTTPAATATIGAVLLP